MLCRQKKTFTFDIQKIFSFNRMELRKNDSNRNVEAILFLKLGKYIE